METTVEMEFVTPSTTDRSKIGVTSLRTRGQWEDYRARMGILV